MSEDSKIKKRTRLSIYDKSVIVQRIDSGEKLKDIAAEYNVSKHAIYKMRIKKTDILKAKDVLENCNGDSKTKFQYSAKEEDVVEQQLFQWIQERKSMGQPVSSSALKKQALIFNKDHEGPDNFCASDGWVARFKKRHGLQSKNKSHNGESLSDNTNANEQLKKKIDAIMNITGVSLDHIYNCDETGLYWKMLPNKKLILKKEKRADSSRTSKNRLTIMLCTNASGNHKIPLFIIGNSVNPDCFAGIKIFSVFYQNQEHAWMTCDLMKIWYSEVFLPEVNEKYQLEKNPHIKIVLMMDNARCHPPVEELNSMCQSCSILYLPSNVKASFQPLARGIIKKFKGCYRKLLIEAVQGDYLLSSFQNESDESHGDFIKSFSLLGCCNFCSFAWHQITSEEIRDSWKKLIPLESNSQIEQIDAEAYQALLKKIPAYETLLLKEIDEWLNIDKDEIGWEPWPDQDDTSSKNTSNAKEKDNEIVQEEELCIPPESIVNNGNGPTLIEAFHASNTILNWYQKNGQNSGSALLDFIKINHELREKLVNNVII